MARLVTRTVVVVFDGNGLVLGNATAKMPGMRVRLHLQRLVDGILETHLDIDGGGPACIPIVHGLRVRYHCNVVPDGPEDGSWHGRVTFLSTEDFRGHAASHALLDYADRMTGACMHFLHGIGYMRLDLPDDIGGPDVAAHLEAKAGSIRHVVAEVQDAGPLETWVPGPGSPSIEQTALATDGQDVTRGRNAAR